MDDGHIGWVSEALIRVVEERRFADLATVVAVEPSGAVEIGRKLLIERDGAPVGSLGDPELDRAVVNDAAAVIAERKSRVTRYDLRDGPEPGAPLRGRPHG